MAINVKSQKFTILELLVVAAIIGILCSLLLPSLNNAREKAIRGVCLSNISQLHKAASTYAVTNDMKLPRGHKFRARENSELLRGLNSDTYELLVSKYLGGNETIFSCPNLGSKYPQEKPLEEGGWVRLGYHYMGDKNMLNDMYPNYAFPDRLDEQPDVPLFGDSICWSPNISWKISVAPHISNGGIIGSTGGIHPKYLGSEGGNFVFPDGSASWHNNKKLRQFESHSVAGTSSVFALLPDVIPW